MLRPLCLTLVLVAAASLSYGQKSSFKPFRFVIITPDTALIDPSVRSFEDTVKQEYIQKFLEGIRQYDQLANDTPFSSHVSITEQEWDKVREAAKKLAANARAHESEVMAFLYYQLIATYSLEVYQGYFNEYPPFSTILVTRKRTLPQDSLKHFADSLKADYVVGYKNVHTERSDSGLIIKLTTWLYAREEDKLLMESETTGDSLSHGDMWTCGNPLSCLLITAVRSSTEVVSPIIARRQIERKP
jgi:hypothetical protein